ncbi:MAG: hypothetical protein ACXVFQ_25765, partial [Solirubrobacteraceae bacterium]
MTTRNGSGPTVEGRQRVCPPRPSLRRTARCAAEHGAVALFKDVATRHTTRSAGFVMDVLAAARKCSLISRAISAAV